MPFTPLYGWPFQAIGDSPDGAALGQNLALAIESTVSGLPTPAAFAAALARITALENNQNSAWLTTWVPTLTNLTLGNGTQITRFKQVGTSVDYYWQFIFGTTSAMGTVPSFTLPVPPAAYYSTGRTGEFPANVHLFQTGVTDRPGAGKLSAGSTVALTSWNATPAQSDITPTNPFVWGNTHLITVYGRYESA